VPSLHTSDDFACDTASDDGSPIDPGNAVDWRTIGEAFASYVVPVQDELAKAEARPDIRGRINVKGKILPPCSPPPLHTAAAPIEPHKFSSGSSINDGSNLCFPCAEENENLQIQNSTPCTYLQMSSPISSKAKSRVARPAVSPTVIDKKFGHNTPRRVH